jgi:hypothetical protein
MLGWPKTRCGALLLSCALALGGCQSAGEGDLSLSGMGAAKVEAPGVPIAFESIDGAPEAMQGEFATALVSEASARRVELVPSEAPARYRIRGYLTAYQSDDGRTVLAFVWDVFDAAKRRTRRLEGAMPGGGRAGPDPWANVGKAQLQQAAAQSMNDIASFLAANPGAGS